MKKILMAVLVGIGLMQVATVYAGEETTTVQEDVLYVVESDLERDIIQVNQVEEAIEEMDIEDLEILINKYKDNDSLTQREQKVMELMEKRHDHLDNYTKNVFIAIAKAIGVFVGILGGMVYVINNW